MNFDELLKQAEERDKQKKSTPKVTLGSIGNKKVTPIPVPSISKAGEERAESALLRAQKTPQTLAEEKATARVLPRAVAAGVAQAPLNIAKAIPSLAAATLAEGGTSKRYEEANKYALKPVSVEQMAQAQRIAAVVPKISYPGTKLDEFISGTQQDIQALQTPGNRILAQAAMAAGQMAPVIATGGIAGAGAGYGVLGAQAYGQSFGEAIERGADVKTAGQYAALSSALELSTEGLVGGIPGLGKGVLSKMIKTPSAVNLASKVGAKTAGTFLGKTASAVGKALSSKGGRLLVNALGEGSEEVIASALAPSIERSTIDPNATDATLSELAESFAVGGLLSAVLGVPSITLSTGKTITKLDDIDTLTPSETKEVEDELYRLARESNIRKGKLTPEGEPIEAMSATDFANMYGLPTPAPQRFNPKTIPLYSGGGLVGNEAYTRAKTIYDNKIKDLTEYIKNYTPKGTTTYFFDENGLSVDPTRDITGNLRRVAVSNNDTWYSDFWKQNNRKPTKGEAKEIAEKIIDDTLKFETDDGFAYDPELIDLIRNIYSEANGTALDILNRAESDSRTFQRGEPTFWGDVEPVKPLRRIKTKEPIRQRIIERPFTVTPGELAMRTEPQPTQPVLGVQQPTQPTFEPLNRPVQARTAQSGTLPLAGIKTEKTRRFAETALGADIVGEELTNEIIGGIKGGMLSSIYKSNKSIVESADTALSQGINSAYGTFKTHFEDGNYTAEDIALGARLAQEYQRDGNIQSAYSVLSDLSIMLQAAGQTVQAAKIIKLLTPEGRLRTLAQIQNAIEKKTGVKISLNQSTLDRVARAETENEIQSALNEARKEIWNKTPSTFADKFNTWRYTAMLGNPKTIMRNEIGNALFAPVRTIKNIVATGLEKTARLPEGKEAILKNAKEFAETGSVGTIRTKSILTPSDKPLIEFALKDSDNVMETLKGAAKYGDMATTTGRPIGVKVFGDSRIGKFIQGWSDLTTKALEEGLGKGFVIRGDAGWLKQIYSKSMAQFMKANELKPDDMTGELLNAARAYAIQEAQKGTYRDANIVSDWLTKQIKRGTTSKNPLAKAVGYIAEGIVPFKRTPLNIARRAVEYSPVGLINGVSSTVQAIKSGENVQTAIDKLAAGLTGTGIVALGTFLASLGLLSGGKGDDKEERYKQTLGLQNYAINIDGKSYTLDWAAPISIPLFVGVELFEQMKDEFELSDILDAFSNVTDPLLEMSMLQGIANIFDTGYSQGGIDVLTTPIKSAAFSLAGQAVPTVLGQIARTIDPITRRLNTATAESGSIRDIQYGISKNIISKLPGIQQTRQPYVDLWGRIGEKNEVGDYVRSALENFLSVGYVGEEKITTVDREIIRLFQETENPDVIPRKTTGYDIKVAGQEYRMTADEKTEFEKTRGSVSFDKLNSLFSTSDYKKMSTEEKNKAISKVYDEAYEEAKKKLALSRGVSSIDYNIKTLPSEKQLKIGAMTSAGIKKEMAYSLLTSVDKNQNGSVAQEELKNAIDQINIPNLQKAKLWEILKTSTWKRANPYSN